MTALTTHRRSDAGFEGDAIMAGLAPVAAGAGFVHDHPSAPRHSRAADAKPAAVTRTAAPTTKHS
jgi:hypothetical protein